MGELLMPSLGADMESGVLLEWRVGPGDEVSRGDIVALVDTSKAEIEIEVFEDGAVEELLVPVGERVPVGTPIARIRAEAVARTAAPAERPPPEPAPPPKPAPPTKAAPPPAVPAPAVAPPPAPSVSASARAWGRQHVSPVARRMAAALGVDLSTVHGTGPHGAIVKADVERAAAHPSENGRPAGPVIAEPTRTRVDRGPAMRAAIAQLMTRANREIPHYHLLEDVDMSAALSFLQRHNETVPIADRVLPAALLVKAVASSLRDVPELNGHWLDGGFVPGAGIHVGFAVSLRGGGLIAPAIRDADSLALPELMRTLRDAVRRARAGTLRSAEVSDATITITNLGENGAQVVHGVIQPPQVGLVGFGRISERPWAEAGMLGVRPVLTATLAADHRATDGYTGGRLLAGIASRLGRPEEL